MRYKPPIAPQTLPRTQSEESSNQEEEPPEPPKKKEGPSMGDILKIISILVVLTACVPLIYLAVISFSLIVVFFQVIFGG